MNKETLMMDRRKSLGHVLLENSTSSITGGLRRRSSITVRSPDVRFNVNDDEAERASLRQASFEQTPVHSTSVNRRSLNLGTVVNMTSPQIADGIAECLKLNTQNKINTKNAFSLNMIDFMSWMAKNKQQDIGNLQMAAMGIDVSAKIYALRVDDLHHKTLNMAGNLEPENNNQPEGEDTNEANTDIEGSQELHLQQKKKKKRSTNKELFTTIEALQGKKDTISLEPIMFGESDCQLSSMLYQYAFPQHCTQDLVLHPYNDIILDEAVAEHSNNSDISISWPPVQACGEKDINSLCINFEFLDYSLDSESNQSSSQSQSSSQPQNQSLSQDNNLVFDLDASLPPDNGFQDASYSCEMHDVSVEHQVACHSKPTGPVMLATLENIIDRIPIQRLEYSIFDQSLNIRWVGPSHWKIKSLVKNQGSSQVNEVCAQNPKKKKKEFKLEYSEKSDIDQKKFKKSKSQLKMSTLKYSWDEEKLFLSNEPCQNQSTNFLCKLFLRPDIIISLINDTVSSRSNDESGEYNNNNLNDTYNDFVNNQMDDIPLNESSIHENNGLDYGPQDFAGTNLIEVPKLTQKIVIPYFQRAKKLDMHKLKKCIWKELISVEQSDQDNNTDANKNAVQGEKSFAHLFENLPNKLSKHDAEELSLPIAFVSLLHLANEKCLKISINNNYSDLKIQQDMP